ncbi:MAG: protein-L-isoaspartate O-methyltransferase [Gammaproteobacteria bacterium]|uniref:Protein-L-isoaspartate O-methyltransferase n=1 Tax=OM182 bacterium MED-G24 TaxID=1986255 RepID=A0A2A5WYJ1_9GAMM|nr:protein-L-isoaspartate O-methyltransferase [Gammaproteobacteria bacterium]PDH41297.1 MAG: protein-L-isoaspartate O-methyltransferase [OM182 bacterium MED-G24]|tara:strand:- start:2205 stop:2870 length:666 start_codon:yes stop_codon:yes gene_type:complete
MNSRADIQGVGMTSARTRARLIARLRSQGITDETVLEVMQAVPRHLFVDEALSHRAYEDSALPIGFNQTISQPYTVARMTELLLEDNRPSRVLEIGTGCGYQAAVLSALVDQVFTIERISGLADNARRTFSDLGVTNVIQRHNDGANGWSERGPFDGMLITASPHQVPPALFAQLNEGGRMILPLETDDGQYLTRVTRLQGEMSVDTIEPAKFVPLLGGSG